VWRPWACGRGLGDQLGHGLILDRAGPAATRFVVEAIDPIGDEAIAPLPIVWEPTPSCVATTALLGSRSQASTIFARNVSAAGSERDRIMAKRCARSSLDIVSFTFGRPVRIGYLLRSGYPKPMQLRT
jgi:hypothetical protein